MKIIIEGIDRLGKDTLQAGLINSLGYHHVIHYSSPKNCDFYEESSKNFNEDPLDAPFWFQHDSFIQGFDLLEQNVNVIYNRFHLGEHVYSQRYRGYDGSYVFGLEKMFPTAMKQTHLFLLYTSNVDIMTDDGKSHDYSKRKEEQEDFFEAFEFSNIFHKHKVDVYDSYKKFYRDKKSILNEVLAKIKNGD